MTITLLSTQNLTASSADTTVNDTPSGTFTATQLTVTDTTPAIQGGQATITEGANTETKRIISVTNGTQFVIEHLTNSYTTAALVTFQGFTNPGDPLGQTTVQGATGLKLNGSKNKAESFSNVHAEDLLALWRNVNNILNVMNKSANYTAVSFDRGALFTCTGSFTLSLTAAATLGNGWYCYVKNGGTGFISVVPNGAETIDGLTSQTIDPRETALIVCDGTNFQTISRGNFPIVIAKSTNYTAAVDDLGVLFNFTSSPVLSLTSAATLGNGWYCYVRNDGTGVATIDPNGAQTVDGNATLTLYPRQSAMLICDGSNFKTIGCPPLCATKYIGGTSPRYNSAASIILPAGMRARDKNDAADIIVTSDITLSLASSGAAGRDTGSEASSTWYYVYLIKKSSDGTVSAVFSTVNESVSGSITLPSGYDTKRQLPFAVRNDGSSNIIPFIITEWGLRCCVRYTTSPTYYDGSFNAGALNVVNAGTATVFTAVSLASLVPPLSSWAILRCMTSTSGRALVRGNAGNAIISIGAGSTSMDGAEFEMGTDSTQNIEYERQPSASPGIYIDCLGYRTTVDV